MSAMPDNSQQRQRSKSRSRYDLIRVAALRNAEGATHLADEELEDAIADFRLTYHCLCRASSMALHEDEKTEDDDKDDVATTLDSDCIPQDFLDKYHFLFDPSRVSWYAASSIQQQATTTRDTSIISDHPGADNDNIDIRLNTNPSAFVYTEALVFHPATATDPEETLFFQSVLYFNMGLTFHRQAVLLQASSNPVHVQEQIAALERALTCYNKCLDGLRQSKGYSTSTNTSSSSSSSSAKNDQNDTNMLVEAHMLFACLNNKSQTLFALREYEQTYYVLQELSSIMTAVSGNPPAFEEAEIRGLNANLNLLHKQEITAAIIANAKVRDAEIKEQEEK